MIAVFLAVGFLVGLALIFGSLFVALLEARRKVDALLAENERLARESDAVTDDRNGAYSRLTRRRNPLIPAQRGATR